MPLQLGSAEVSCHVPRSTQFYKQESEEQRVCNQTSDGARDVSPAPGYLTFLFGYLFGQKLEGASFL